MYHKELEIIGWAGVIAIVLGYLLTNFGVIELKSWLYLLLNLFGSVAILTEALRKKDYQPVVLNVIWALVALVGVISLF